MKMLKCIQNEKCFLKLALFFLVNSYTTGLQPAVLTYMLNSAIAKKMGVSTVTVHKALNNQHGVSEKTKGRGEKAISTMGESDG